MISNTNPCSHGGKRLAWGHLGGTSVTGDPDSWFPELWDWLIKQFNITSMFDVGCGVGFSQKWFHDNNIDSMGLDCEQMRAFHLIKDRFVAHDLTVESWFSGNQYSLVWCCEVAEHIKEKFSNNLIDTLAGNCGRVLAFCAASVGAGGIHHVNCQNPPYWREKIEKAGLVYDQSLTDQAKGLCGPTNGRGKQNYFARSGMIFLRI